MKADEIVEVKWFNNQDADKKTSMHIRKTVFIEEQKLSLEFDFDEKDSKTNLETMNLLLFFNKIPVATTRLIYKDSKWFLSRFCILKEYRGKKLGNYIMNAIFKKSEESKIETIYGSAEVDAKEFFRKHGFIEFGVPFLNEHMPLIMMTKKFKPSL